MEVHDTRGKELAYIDQITNRFPANTHYTQGLNYSHRLTTDTDIDNCIDKARLVNAEMVLIQEYGITWYIPHNKPVTIIEPGIVQGIDGKQYYNPMRIIAS